MNLWNEGGNRRSINSNNKQQLWTSPTAPQNITTKLNSQYYIVRSIFTIN